MFKKKMNRLSKGKDMHISTYIWERYAYKYIHLRQYSCHIKGHMKFSSHCEMRMGAAK